MSNQDSEPDPPSPGLLFDEFLADNYHLFVIVGVLGAISVYLSSVREQGIYGEALIPVLDIAVIASLTLVIIVSLYVNFMFVFLYTDELTAPTALFSRKSILFAFFLVPYNVLIASVIILLVRFEHLVHFVIGLVSFIGGILGYGMISQRIFAFFEWRAEAEGYGIFLGVAAFGVYNLLLFAGAMLVLSALVGSVGGVGNLFVLFSNGTGRTALLSFVVGMAVMPIIMLLGFLLYLSYYKTSEA